MAKAKSITKYECDLCEEEFHDEFSANGCEKGHRELAGLLKIGAKVKWFESVADRGVTVRGHVIGFKEEEGALCVVVKMPKGSFSEVETRRFDRVSKAKDVK